MVSPFRQWFRHFVSGFAISSVVSKVLECILLDRSRVFWDPEASNLVLKDGIAVQTVPLFLKIP